MGRNKENLPEDIFDVLSLPTPDFAKYLISSVKFHCGQLFYLFNEDRYMANLPFFNKILPKKLVLPLCGSATIFLFSRSKKASWPNQPGQRVMLALNTSSRLCNACQTLIF